MAVCALQRRRRDGEEYRQNVEKKNMNLEPIVTAYFATKGMREVGQLSLLLLLWLFFFLVFFTMCQCSTVNSHSTYDVIPPNIFSEKKSVVLLPLFMYLLIPVLMWKLVPFLIEFIPFFQTMLLASQDFNFDPLSQHTSNPSKLYVARKFNKHVL